MTRFLKLCEQFDPTRSGDIHDLISFLKRHNINASLVSGGQLGAKSNQLTIDIGDKVVYLTVMEPEEEAESIDASTGTYEVDNEVKNLANTASKGPAGLVGKMFGTAPQQAKSAVKERGRLNAQAVDAYRKGTQRIQKGLAKVKQSTMDRSY
jgi:hypothetical protein